MTEQRALSTEVQAPTRQTLTRAQIELVKRTIAPDATDEELMLFVQACNETGLNPFTKEIYFVKYKTKRGPVVAIVTGIDGYRKFAERSAEYRGQVGPFWCGPDGEWKEVWLSDEPPVAAKVGVLKGDNHEPIWGIAKWKTFAKNTELWQQMPDHMLAIRAESHALRKAFPQAREDMRRLNIIYDDELLARMADRARVEQALPRHRPPVSLAEVRADLFGEDDDLSEVPEEESEPVPEGVRELQQLMERVNGMDVTTETVTEVLADLGDTPAQANARILAWRKAKAGKEDVREALRAIVTAAMAEKGQQALL